MGEKNQIIEPEKIKVVSSPQFIIVVIGFAFTFGSFVATFWGTKSQVNKLQDQVELLNKDISSKIDLQNTVIQNHFLELHKATSRIEGKLDALSGDRVK